MTGASIARSIRGLLQKSHDTLAVCKRFVWFELKSMCCTETCLLRLPMVHCVRVHHADVALITSLRDGMNLVSYEYVACQADNAGVLVLSEFAGAAQSLGAGALQRGV